MSLTPEQVAVMERSVESFLAFSQNHDPSFRKDQARAYKSGYESGYLARAEIAEAEREQHQQQLETIRDEVLNADANMLDCEQVNYVLGIIDSHFQTKNVWTQEMLDRAAERAKKLDAILAPREKGDAK